MTHCLVKVVQDQIPLRPSTSNGAGSRPKRPAAMQQTDDELLRAGIKRLTVENTELEWYKCCYCKYETNRIDSIRRHQVSRHGETNVLPCQECQFCSYKSYAASNMKKHMRSIHS